MNSGGSARPDEPRSRADAAPSARPTSAAARGVVNAASTSAAAAGALLAVIGWLVLRLVNGFDERRTLHEQEEREADLHEQRSARPAPDAAGRSS